ncbi:nucleotidyltransferase domain-containing protein [bacterium]|nr:nucleotidyltransferase domain-containing protein [bacterium]
MFGLEEKTILEIQEAIAKNPLIDKVILYGSRAKGNFRTGSDIDITLIGKELNLNNSVYPLMDAIEELCLPYMFDISVFNQIDDENLIDHINRVGKILYLKRGL